MLLQTNSYIVPADRRLDHQRLIRRFRQVMTKLGCDSFEVYEQAGPNWGAAESTGRFVQIMRFRDRQHQRQVQAAERSDSAAQALIAEFCELINLPYQQQQGFFAVGYYTSVVATAPALHQAPTTEQGERLQYNVAPEEPPEDVAEIEDVGQDLAPEAVSPVETGESAADEAELAVEAAPEAEVERLAEAEPAEAASENLESHAEHEGEMGMDMEAGEGEPAAEAQYGVPREDVPDNHQPIASEEEEPQTLVFDELPEDERGGMGESTGEFDIEAIAEQEVGGFEQSPEEQKHNE